MITTGGIVLTGYLATKDINEAKLIESVLPQMISKNPLQEKAALFVVKKGASNGTWFNLIQWLATEYVTDIVNARNNNNREEEIKLLKQTGYVDPELSKIVNDKLRQYQENVESEDNKKPLSCEPVSIFFADTNGIYPILVDSPNCKKPTSEKPLLRVSSKLCN